MNNINVNRKRKYDEFIGKVSSEHIEIDYSDYLAWLTEENIIKSNIAHELISSEKTKKPLNKN
jgi:hypothetical protein